jgi:hypothetical protein
MKPSPIRCLFAVVSLLLASAAVARDGLIEINQVRALAGGVTAGDTPGFPVTIDATGSYLLTGNLDVRNAPAGTSAIEIRADAVQLDLNGFRLLGPQRCSGDPPATAVTCMPAGSAGVGVHFDVALQSLRGARIRNGTIEGFHSSGILCRSPCEIEQIQTRHNGVGLSAAPHSTVHDVVAELNAGIGILSESRTQVSHVNVSANGSWGLRLGPGSILSDCNASRNALVGLWVVPAVPGDDSAAVAYRDCVFVRNNGGNANAQVAATALSLGGNICGTDTTCP